MHRIIQLLMLYTDVVEDQKAELAAVIAHAMDCAHHLFARMRQLHGLVSTEYDVETTPHHLARARSIAVHLLAEHQAQCRRGLELLDELKRELPAKAG